MSLIPPLGKPNPQLTDALKRLSSAKYGVPRAQVEQDIFARLRSGDADKEARKQAALDRMRSAPGAGAAPKPAGGSSSFLDEWLAKRKKQVADKPAATSVAPSQQPVLSQTVASSTTPGSVAEVAPQAAPLVQQTQALPQQQPKPVRAEQQPQPVVNPSIKPAEELKLPLHSPQHLLFTQESAPKPQHDARLDAMQQRGIGGNISFGHMEIQKKVTHDDHIALENALQETKNTDVMRESAQPAAVPAPQPRVQPHEGELKLKRTSAPSPDSFSVPGEDNQADFDEIYIDVRGRLHHRTEDEDSSKTTPTTQKPADKPQA